MNFGQLNRKVIIQRSTATRSTSGQASLTWADTYTVCANVGYRNGGEKFEDRKETGYVNQTFLIRYISGIDETYRVKDEYGHLFDVEYVEEVGKRQYQILYGKRKTNYVQQ